MIILVVLVLLSLVIPILWPLTLLAIVVYLFMSKIRMILILGIIFVVLMQGCGGKHRDDPEHLSEQKTAPLQSHVSLSPSGLPIVKESEAMYQLESGPLAHERGW